MSNLVVLNSYPELVSKIDLVKMCNKFVSKTQCTGRRESLFGKFVEIDLVEENKNPANWIESAAARINVLTGSDNLKDCDDPQYGGVEW